ncbi:MAG: cation transporter [bacterium]|nr:cation transporter [bacterium]
MPLAGRRPVCPCADGGLHRAPRRIRARRRAVHACPNDASHQPNPAPGNRVNARTQTAGTRAALTGIFVNALLAVVKLTAGVLGHSQALIADAVESLADIAGSTIVWGGLTVAAKPPDKNHPYGHGKAESLATLAVAFMLWGAAIGIAIQSVREILTPDRAPAAFTLPVLLVVIVVKETLYRRVQRVGRELGSTAVQSDAWHHRSDALTSLAAAIGISIALIGGEAYAVADDWAALVACLIIATNGSRFLKKAADELMDVSPGDAFFAAARETAQAVEGVRGVEKLFARKMGSRFLVDMHLEVDPSITVEQGHHIGHQVKSALLDKHERISDVLVHLEPHGIAWDV